MNTINRDHLKRSMEAVADAGVALPGDLDVEDLDGLGVSEDRITTTVDVRPWLARKRAGMAAHASQISETSFFLAMDPEMFEGGFGQEWFIRCDAAPGLVETELLDGSG
jgi:LmbE family N-acetylglucosaminyl deacetylase